MLFLHRQKSKVIAIHRLGEEEEAYEAPSSFIINISGWRGEKDLEDTEEILRRRFRWSRRTDSTFPSYNVLIKISLQSLNLSVLKLSTTNRLSGHFRVPLCVCSECSRSPMNIIII